MPAPKSSSNHSPIIIIGNAELDAFCAGNGTSGNITHPHVIENYDITISNNSRGIWIKDTTRYLIIRNCTITTEFTPVGSENPESYGILFDNCRNVKIINNTFIKNDFGIAFQWSPDNIIEQNTFQNNSFGINLYLSDSVNITQNNITGHSPWHYPQVGIDSFISDNIIISENNISNKEDGVTITGSKFNIVTYNNITNQENGIIIENDSQNNTISNNNIINSSEKGVFIFSSTNNTLYENYLIDGGFHLYLGSYYSNSINTSNLVNQKPFFFGLDQNSIVIDGDIDEYGQILLVNCNHSSITNLNVVNLYQGITAEACENITIFDNEILNNIYGIVLSHSSGSEILKNDIIGNKYGIFLTYSDLNAIYGNNCSYNSLKNIHLTYCYNNSIYQNILNSPGAFSGHDEFGDFNIWDNGIVGNFYHNYLAHYPEANNNGGIWDTPYSIPGNSSSFDRYPLVNLPILEDVIPISNFTVNATEIVEGQSVQFYWNPTGEPGGNPPLNFTWNFGDGTNNTSDFYPVHSYFDPGEFDVNFTISDFEGNTSISNTITITVVVDLFPNASFIFNETIYYEGDEVQFQDNTTDGNLPLMYQWDFGDNSPNSTLKNPNHTFNSAGSYVVTLTVTDLDGDISVYSTTIWINIKPQGNDMFVVFLSLTAFFAVFELVALKAKWNKWVKLISGIGAVGSGIATIAMLMI